MAKTLDSIMAGMRPPVYVFKNKQTSVYNKVLWSTAYLTGFPGAASVPASGLSGEALTAWDGRIPVDNATSGYTLRLTNVAIMNYPLGHTMLIDRMWQNSGIVPTTTTAQSFSTPVAIPPRDANGSTDGVGVMVALETNTNGPNVGGGNLVTTTISYTNSSGTAGRTGTITGVYGMPASTYSGAFIPFELQTGDVGVRSVESITLTRTYNAAGLSVVLFRPLWAYSDPVVSRLEMRDCAETGMPIIYDDSCLMFLNYNYNTSAVGTQAMLGFSEMDES